MYDKLHIYDSLSLISLIYSNFTLLSKYVYEKFLYKNIHQIIYYELFSK